MITNIKLKIVTIVLGFWMTSAASAETPSNVTIAEAKSVTSASVREDFTNLFRAVLNSKEAEIAADSIIIHLASEELAPIYALNHLCQCVINGTDKKFVNVSSILSHALHLTQDPHMVTNPQELRFLPAAIDGSSLVLIITPGDGLTVDQITTILAVAKRKHLSISLVIKRPKGQTSYDETFMKALLRLAGESSGTVLDLSSEGRAAE